MHTLEIFIVTIHSETVSFSNIPEHSISIFSAFILDPLNKHWDQHSQTTA